jgi:uncharacterized UBP type Zn finger protein
LLLSVIEDLQYQLTWKEPIGKRSVNFQEMFQSDGMVNKDCERCRFRTPHDSTTMTAVRSTTTSILIRAQRTTFVNKTILKIQTNIENVPEILQFPIIDVLPEQQKSFVLAGFAIHKGDNPWTGHWIYCTRRQGQTRNNYDWYLVDDENINMLAIMEVEQYKKQASLYIYIL